MAPTENTATPVEQKTPFQQWERDPEPQVSADPTPAPEKAAAQDEPAPDTATENKKQVDPDDRYEDLPKWARKEIRKERAKAQELNARIQELESAVKQPKESAAPVQATASGEPAEPSLEDFATVKEYSDAHRQYIRDLARWEVKQERLAEQAELTKAQQQKADAAARDAWTKQAKAIEDEFDDFEDVAYSPTLKVTDVMFGVMQESDNGAKLLYHLGKNPELSAEIAAMSPARQALAIGKLEARLFPETETSTKPANVTKAPKPPKPIAGASRENPDAEPDPKDFVKWNKWKDRQERAALAS